MVTSAVVHTNHRTRRCMLHSYNWLLAGAIDGDLYASYIMKMLNTIVEVGTDSDGDATYR